MAELDTEAKVQAYLDQIFPSETYSLVPFELGWVCQPILSPAEMADGMGIGLTNLVIDTATGVVTEYPSWCQWPS